MATASLKVTTYSTVTITYDVYNLNETQSGIRMTGLTFTNSRSGGTPSKLNNVYLALQNTAGQGIVGTSGQTAAKGTKSKSWSVSSSGGVYERGTSATGVSVRIYCQLDFDKTYEKYGSYFTVTIPARPSYTLAYDGNGATGGSTPAQTIYVGIAATAAQNGFTRAGYRFWKWLTPGNMENDPGANLGVQNANTTLTALWHQMPVVDSLTLTRVTDSTGDTASETGEYLKCEAAWHVDASKYASNRGASIAFSCGPVESTAALSGTSGTVTKVLAVGARADTPLDVTATVTDTQFGDEGSATETSATAYAQPVITSLEANRVDFSGDLADEGTRLAVTVGWRVSSIGSQAAPESLTVQVGGVTVTPESAASFSPTTEGGMATGTTTVCFLAPEAAGSETYQRCTETSVVGGKPYFAKSGTTFARVASPTGSPASKGYYELRGFLADSEYQVTATLADTLNEAWQAVDVPSAFFTMDVRTGGHGVSFGEPASEGTFNVALPPTYKGKPALPYLQFGEAWTPANLAACKAAVADYRPCVARFGNGAVVEFDSDPETDSFN